MSTKGIVSFAAANGTVMAAVYVHNAGRDMHAELKEFFAAVLDAVGEAPNATRFHDPCYLAARYVAWKAGGAGAGLASVGVITDPGRWHVHRRFSVWCHAEPSVIPPDVSEEGL